MLLGAPLGAGTPHWCARSIIGHDSPVFQHGGLFSWNGGHLVAHENSSQANSPGETSMPLDV